EQKQDCAHEKSREKNPDCNQHAQLRETHRAAQNQREKTDCGSERAKEYRAAKLRHGSRNRLLIFLAVDSRLLITAENQNREIDAESNQDCAEPDRDHVESAEAKQPDRERDQA